MSIWILNIFGQIEYCTHIYKFIINRVSKIEVQLWAECGIHYEFRLDLMF